MIVESVEGCNTFLRFVHILHSTLNALFRCLHLLELDVSHTLNHGILESVERLLIDKHIRPTIVTTHVLSPLLEDDIVSWGATTRATTFVTELDALDLELRKLLDEELLELASDDHLTHTTDATPHNALERKGIDVVLVEVLVKKVVDIGPDVDLSVHAPARSLVVIDLPLSDA